MSASDSVDVPMICDAPAGRIVVVHCPFPLNDQTYIKMKRRVEQQLRDGGVIVLENGMTLEVIQPEPAWPDAEHCAA